MDCGWLNCFLEAQHKCTVLSQRINRQKVTLLSLQFFLICRLVAVHAVHQLFTVDSIIHTGVSNLPKKKLHPIDEPSCLQLHIVSCSDVCLHTATLDNTKTLK